MVGSLPARDSISEDHEGVLLYWGTQKIKSFRDMQNTLSLHRGPVVEPGRGPFSRTFERKVYVGSFLGPGGH